MSNEVLVDVRIKCSRDGKEYPVTVAVSEAQTIVDTANEKIIAAEEIQGALSRRGDCPDLIVIYKGKGTILANVNAKHDAAIHRLVNDMTKQEIFTLEEATPRTRRTKAQIEADNAAKAAADEG